MFHKKGKRQGAKARTRPDFVLDVDSGSVYSPEMDTKELKRQPSFTTNRRKDKMLVEPPDLSYLERALPLEDNHSLPLQAVVCIFATIVPANYESPWAVRPGQDVGGSGFIIDKRRILTNAHVIQDSTMVMVQKFGTAQKFSAKVVAVGYDVDIAVLSVDNSAFWDDESVTMAFSTEIPDLYSPVTVCGFPTGGSTISVTKGIVSRVDLMPYNTQSDTSLLTVQIDAAINPGNSGGPVLNGDMKVVGIAFSVGDQLDNVGYIIPSQVIQSFLTLTAAGPFIGMPQLGFRYDQMENRALRDYMGMPEHVTGVLVNEVSPLSAANTVLKADDVILQINGNQINNDATVMFRRDELITFDYLITSSLEPTTFVVLRRKAVGKKTESKSDAETDGRVKSSSSASGAARKGSDKQKSKARKSNDSKEKETTKEGRSTHKPSSSGSRSSRKHTPSPAELGSMIGSELEIVTETVSLKPFPSLIPRYSGFDAVPKYLIVGGVVFTNLTFPLILEGRVNLSAGMVENALLSYKQNSDQDLVVLLKILKDEVNYGYDIPACEQLKEFNGKSIQSLKQLTELVDAALHDTSLRHLVFTFGTKKDKIILDRLQVVETEKQILTMHHIPSRSN